MTAERIQKILAQAGIASRRKAEELIVEGLVTVNGKVVKLGDKAEFGKDAIKVGGRLLQTTEAHVYLAFYKPKSVLSTLSDPEGRLTISDFLRAVKTRVYPIGRMDFNSEGLILLTNDGDFAAKLQRKTDIPRTYHVKVKGHPEAEGLMKLKRGLRAYHVRVAEELHSKAVIEVVLMGSKSIDLKTSFEHKGFLVDKMTRTSIGHLTLRGLTPGKFRYLKKSQVEALLTQPELGLPHKAED